MIYMVCYDVTHTKRLRKVAKILEDLGLRVQKSFFQCDIDERRKDLLVQRMVKVLNLKKDYQLTDREMEILEMLIKRLTNKEISRQLFISIPTVKTHLANIYQKLDVRNRDELLSFLREEGDN